MNKLVPLPSPILELQHAPLPLISAECWKRTLKSPYFHILEAEAHLGPSLGLGSVSIIGRSDQPIMYVFKLLKNI